MWVKVVVFSLILSFSIEDGGEGMDVAELDVL
jgi:hypothetical protein